MRISSCRMIAVVVLAGSLGVGEAQIQNSAFDSGLANWNASATPPLFIGNVAVTVNGNSNQPNNLAMFTEPAPPGSNGQGSLSQIWQAFTLPATPTVLSFRFRFLYDPLATPSAVPPDSFLAFLIEDDGDPVVAHSLPDFSIAFFYADANGVRLYDTDTVHVGATLDPDGLQPVTLDLTSVAGNSSARVIFALNSAANGVNSTLLLDDVKTECPTGWCCGDGDILVQLDDGDPCTEDVCNTTGTLCDAGQAVCHLDAACENCTECSNSTADVVIVFDTTGSTSDVDLKRQKAAAKAFLNYFATAPAKPRVAIETFHGPCQTHPDAPCNPEPPDPDCNPPPNKDCNQTTPCNCAQPPVPTPCCQQLNCCLDMARIKAEFTTEYGQDSVDGYNGLDVITSDPGTGLYEVINRVPSTGGDGYTNIAKGLEVASDYLTDNGNPASNGYIILISDGLANKPDAPSDPEDVSCYRKNIQDIAKAAADDAKAAGHKIVSVFYRGSGNGTNCTEPAWNKAIELMQYVATSEDYYFDAREPSGTPPPIPPIDDSQLVCTFYDIVQVISCDDDDDVTRDCCILGRCGHGNECP